MNSPIDIEVQQLLLTESPATVIEHVKTVYHDERLGNKTLALLFLAYIDVIGWEDKDAGISPLIETADLIQINKGYDTKNGNQWARSDSGFLASKYEILRPNRNQQIKLNGKIENIKSNRGKIRAEIKKEISSKRCAILDVGGRSGKPIEVDHKNGRYNDPRVMDTKTQTIDDFQPLSKAANDAKRHHCQVCTQTHLRYNAQKLGYKEGWVVGNEADTICEGCYWYDPQQFNRTISKDFHKDEDGSE